MRFVARLFLVAALAVSLRSGEPLCAPEAAPGGKDVWILVFSSSKCPKCKGLDRTLAQLEKKYPLKVKRLDVSNPEDRALFRKFEAIHAERDFEIPLIVVGDTILIGEKAVKKRLESSVRKSASRGGAALPYLGDAGDGGEGDSRCPSCERRPPTLREELEKIKKIFRGAL
jgi:thiol-disulfide isomerase/thioredoxin